MRFLDTGLRLLLIGLTISAAWSSTGRLVALEIARRVPGPEGIEAALAWDPSNPEFYVQRARQRQSRLEILDLEGARADWEKALQLNPYFWLYWQDFGHHLEMADLPEAAEAALRKAVELSPRNGRHYWALANFYLRQGQPEKIVAPLSTCLQLEDTYLLPAAQLLLSAQMPLTVLDQVWPRRLAAIKKLFDFMVHHWDRVESVWGIEVFQDYWNRLLDLPGVDLSPSHFESYLNQLLVRERPWEARARWVELMAHNGRPDPGYADRQEWVWDGEFEWPLNSGVFDWQLNQDRAFEIRSAPMEGREGSTALRIRFRGRQNPQFNHLRQMLILEPGANLNLSYWASTENVLSHQGFHWVLRNLRSGWTFESPSFNRTDGWRRFSQELKLPEAGVRYELVLSGLPSDRAIDRQSAVLRLDSISLAPAGTSVSVNPPADGN